jgi:hypothetical protein
LHHCWFFTKNSNLTTTTLTTFVIAAKGQFTYWSQRTFAREPNKGLRLDYFVCSKSIFPSIENELTNNDEDKDKDKGAKVKITGEEGQAVRRCLPKSFDNKKGVEVGALDSYILHTETEGTSDHASIVLVLEMRWNEIR